MCVWGESPPRCYKKCLTWRRKHFLYVFKKSKSDRPDFVITKIVVVKQIERSVNEEECFLRKIKTWPLTCKRVLWVIGKATVCVCVWGGGGK